jgi:uncharacterized protein
MQIYLPIADLPVSIILLLILGGIGGFLAGMFGIGGGFIITPILMFIGVPPAISVATSTCQIIASSVAGFLTHYFKKNVDMLLGRYLIYGGFVGSLVGMAIFAKLKAVGLIDIFISMFYVAFLGTISYIMMRESYRSVFKGINKKPDLSKFLAKYNLPYKKTFPASKIEVSILLPIIIGSIAGLMVVLMGVGGGFVVIPALLYILNVPQEKVVGTCLFQIVFLSIFTTMMHAVSTRSVDIVLAIILMIGGIYGSRLGAKMVDKLPSNKARLILSAMIFLVCVKLAFGLFVRPSNLFIIEEVL